MKEGLAGAGDVLLKRKSPNRNGRNFIIFPNSREKRVRKRKKNHKECQKEKANEKDG